jgi:hypothetical protein
VIYKHGGFHVPLTTTWSKEKCGAFGEDSVSLDPGSPSGIFSEESLKVCTVEKRNIYLEPMT